MGRFLDFLIEGKLPQTNSPFLNRLGSLGSGLSNPNMFAGARSIFQALNPNHNFAGSHGWMNQAPTGMNDWGPMRNGYQVGPNFNSGLGSGSSGVPYPTFTDWSQGPQPPSQDQIFQGPPEELAGQPPMPQEEQGRNRGMFRPATPWTRAQQESQIEGARTLSSLNRGRMQAREMMNRMYEGQVR